jgi:hypothetical protein
MKIIKMAFAAALISGLSLSALSLQASGEPVSSGQVARWGTDRSSPARRQRRLISSDKLITPAQRCDRGPFISNRRRTRRCAYLPRAGVYSGA